MISDNSCWSAAAMAAASGYFFNIRGKTFSADLRVVQFNSMQHNNMAHSLGQTSS